MTGRQIARPVSTATSKLSNVRNSLHAINTTASVLALLVLGPRIVRSQYADLWLWERIGHPGMGANVCVKKAGRA